MSFLGEEKHNDIKWMVKVYNQQLRKVGQIFANQ